MCVCVCVCLCVVCLCMCMCVCACMRACVWRSTFQNQHIGTTYYTHTDFGVSTGLISQGYWEQSKWYFVNLERGNIADKLQPRNINVSFTNNSEIATFLSM